jgi:hypothetical protein
MRDYCIEMGFLFRRMRKAAKSALSRRPRRSTVAPGALRWSRTTTARSSSVSARARIVAIAFGAQVENRRG